MVWVRFFKYKYYGVKIIRFVVVFVVCYFYGGVLSRNRVMERFVIFGGIYIKYFFSLKDRKRL